MTTTTSEQLIGRAQARLELMQAASREFQESPSVQMDLELARIALASLDAEPVVYMYKDGDDIEYNGHNEFSGGGKGVPLYTAPPAPVVPDAISTRQAISKMEECDPCDSVNVAYKYGWNACRASMLQAGNSPVTTDCWCRTCLPVTMSDMRFVVCPDCGNKRCPHANDHRNACSGSNEPGQAGSAYPAAPQQEVKS
ncbi:hypothetical protein OEE91_003010 [Citrobacter freundii]